VPSIRLDQLSLVVRDVVAARTFYARLGVGFGEQPDPTWARHHVTAPQGEVVPFDFELDSTVFAPKWNVGWPGGHGVVLGFKVGTRQDVDDLVAELRAEGAVVQQEPYDAFWGARYAVVSDPDGNGVGIMSPVDPARRTTPPDPS
jgi:catechol 2,3-dioxygenase-like lactoylglutathione lyase family enzyme